MRLGSGATNATQQDWLFCTYQAGHVYYDIISVVHSQGETPLENITPLRVELSIVL